jgi:hypothetical protein
VETTVEGEHTEKQGTRIPMLKLYGSFSGNRAGVASHVWTLVNNVIFNNVLLDQKTSFGISSCAYPKRDCASSEIKEIIIRCSELNG